MLKGGVLVRDELLEFGVGQFGSTICPLCDGGRESIDHAFLPCKCASKRVWNILFFAIVWTIWESRNDMIFHGISVNLGKALDTIKFRVALWFKNYGAGAEADLTLLMLDLKERCVDFWKVKKSRIKVMALLSRLQLYFHVDGSSRGNPGDTSIGGVLRDHGGKIVSLLSFSMGWLEVVTAEVLAIHRAFQLIVDNRLLNGCWIDILSDSKPGLWLCPPDCLSWRENGYRISEDGYQNRKNGYMSKFKNSKIQKTVTEAVQRVIGAVNVVIIVVKMPPGSLIEGDRSWTKAVTLLEEIILQYSSPPPATTRVLLLEQVEFSEDRIPSLVNETSLLLLNPYAVFKRKRSLSRRVTALVQDRSPPIKEYVQPTALDNCLVPASTAEQYVDLEIGQPLIEQWIKEGYSHLYIGAIRIVLTLHGKKGLSVTARIAFLQYHL
ncbi:hypothetical protein Ddye_021645 [Dipteronia dyeriana]|uniref:RNase H type-1 domain-containing protein n=1 Tax=Dipteronia dyeriana TaxID=168575 RepID=A0AAD9U321_9ROSI|nr:hypothetical protein Ddye_021645 [Dipteronia dyeriana]